MACVASAPCTAAPLTAVVLLAALSPTPVAGESEVQVILGHVAGEAPSAVQRQPVDRVRPTVALVVIRPVVEPAAVVDRELSEQPVLPHLAEVNVNTLTVLVDPQACYARPTGGIDINHTIRQAQRLHGDATARRARVVRRPQADAPESAEQRDPAPHPILIEPIPRPPTLRQVRDRPQAPG